MGDWGGGEWGPGIGGSVVSGWSVGGVVSVEWIEFRGWKEGGQGGGGVA